MPILYSKNNINNVKNIKEMEQSEAIFVIMVQPMYSFTTEQSGRMLQIGRDYYDSNLSGCMSCGSGLRLVKDTMIKLYKENKDIIDIISTGQLLSDPIIEPIVEPVVTKSTRKKNK